MKHLSIVGLLGFMAYGCAGPTVDPDAPPIEQPKYTYSGTWQEEGTNTPITYEFEGSHWKSRQTIGGKEYEISGTFYGSEKSLTFTRTDDLDGKVSNKAFQMRNFIVQVEWIDGKHFNIHETSGVRKFAKQN